MITGRDRDDFLLFDGPVTASVELNGRRVTNFGGCSYLGLTGHPLAAKAAKEAIDQYGIGASVSRAYGVANPLLLDLEKATADFFGVEDAFCTGAGYLSSPLALAALSGPKTRIYLNKVCHHSIQFGAAATGQPVEQLPHGLGWSDPESLSGIVASTLKPGETPLFAMDGVTGLMGDIAPLPEFLTLAEEFDGLVYMDDAHGVGTLGAAGRGTAEHFAVRSERLCRGATYSKALGGLGGFLFGSHTFIDKVRASPISRGSNLGSIANAAAMIALFDYLVVNRDCIRREQDNIAYMKKQLVGLGLDLSLQPSPIASFSIGDLQAHTDLQQSLLKDDGLFVCQSTHTGASKDGVIRIGVFADHSKDHLDKLVQALKKRL